MRRSDFEQSQGQGGRVVVPWLVEVGSVSKKIGRESTSAMTCLLLGIPIAEMCIFVLSKMNNSKLLQGTLVWWLILKVWRPSVITLLKLDLKMDMQEMVWGKKGLNIAAGGPSGRRISGSLCEFGTSQGPVAPEPRRHGLQGLHNLCRGWESWVYGERKWAGDNCSIVQRSLSGFLMPIFFIRNIYIYMSMTYTHVYHIYTYSHMYVYVYVYIVYSIFFAFIYRHV